MLSEEVCSKAFTSLSSKATLILSRKALDVQLDPFPTNLPSGKGGGVGFYISKHVAQWQGRS